MKRILPPILTSTDFYKAAEYANEIRQSDPEKYNTAEGVLLTHSKLHDNIKETVESIISEYTLDQQTRILFIGIAALWNKNTTPVSTTSILSKRTSRS